MCNWPLRYGSSSKINSMHLKQANCTYPVSKVQDTDIDRTPTLHSRNLMKVPNWLLEFIFITWVWVVTYHAYHTMLSWPEFVADWAQIAKFACMNGVRVHAAGFHFTKEFKSKISTSTIRSMKLPYLNHICSGREVSPDRPTTALPLKKQGGPLLLGNKTDAQLQLYMYWKKFQEQGGVITSSVVVAAAWGLLMGIWLYTACGIWRHGSLTRQWAYHLLEEWSSSGGSILLLILKIRRRDILMRSDDDPQLGSDWNQFIPSSTRTME